MPNQLEDQTTEIVADIQNLQSIETDLFKTLETGIANKSLTNDQQNKLVDQINNVSALNRRDKISIQAPLIDKSKEEIVKLGVKLGVDFSNTWTCYEGEELACGECTACSLRIKGFIDAKLIDPIRYKISVPWEKYKCKAIV